MKARYEQACGRKQRSKLISEAEEMTGLTRKYVIKWLNGTIFHRRHKGRGSTYSPDARKTLREIWKLHGRMCPLYLHARMKHAIQDYIAATKRILSQPIIDELLRMSVSTIERAVKPFRQGKRRPTKRSGSAALRNQIPAGPCLPDPSIPVGILQVDTVALCGGNMSGDFFYILVVTEITTQWTAFYPCWNRSAAATIQALKHIFEHLPFEPRIIHTDNGPEFINYHLPVFLAENYPNVIHTRSRPYRKNDNCRVEQKNYSIIRELFENRRFDDLSQYEALVKLCDDWSRYNNFTVPCRTITSKTRKPGSATAYTFHFDEPRTPFERLNEILPQPPPEHVNAILLRADCLRRLNHLYNTQNTLAGR